MVLLSRCANLIQNFCQKVERIHGKYLEIAACIIYAVAHMLMAIVQEPWYDEAIFCLKFHIMKGIHHYGI